MRERVRERKSESEREGRLKFTSCNVGFFLRLRINFELSSEKANFLEHYAS